MSDSIEATAFDELWRAPKDPSAVWLEREMMGDRVFSGGGKMSEPKIEVGRKAPEFTLLDQDECKVSLSDFKGAWVVLYFYPKDDTPGCTTEACEFTAGIAGFEGLNAVVLGCSPDSPEKHRKFIAKHDLRVRLLSDPEHGVMEAYGAWGEKNMYGKVKVGVIRSTVIIDPDGRAAHRWKSVKAKGHAEKVRERIEQLQGG